MPWYPRSDGALETAGSRLVVTRGVPRRDLQNNVTYPFSGCLDGGTAALCPGWCPGTGFAEPCPGFCVDWSFGSNSYNQAAIPCPGFCLFGGGGISAPCDGGCPTYGASCTVGVDAGCCDQLTCWTADGGEIGSCCASEGSSCSQGAKGTGTNGGCCWGVCSEGVCFCGTVCRTTADCCSGVCLDGGLCSR